MSEFWDAATFGFFLGSLVSGVAVLGVGLITGHVVLVLFGLVSWIGGALGCWKEQSC